MIEDRANSRRGFAFVGGVLLMIAAVPLLFLALLLGSGGEMIQYESSADHIELAMMLGVPLLIFALGASLAVGSRSGRYWLALVFAVLIPLDVIAEIQFSHWRNQPEPPRAGMRTDPSAVIPVTEMARSAPAPEIALCTPGNSRCVPATIHASTYNAQASEPVVARTIVMPPRTSQPAR